MQGGSMRERCWHRHVRVRRLAVSRRVDRRWWRSLRRRLVVDAGARKFVEVDLHVAVCQSLTSRSECIDRLTLSILPLNS